MKIVIFGAPGAGKGTQAAMISHEFAIPHISTGDLFRKHIGEGTPLGVVAKSYIDEGHLVPDEITVQLLKDRLSQSDCESFLLDGFPRTLAQARLLDDVTDIDLVVDLDVDEEKIVDRIVNRMVCSCCGKSFNRHSFDGDKCDECGAELHQRDDDKEEVIRERIKEYKQKTFPIQQYYESKGKLAKIDGNRKVEDVLSDVRKVLSDYRKNG